MDRDTVIALVSIVQHEVEDYARGGGWQETAYPVSDTAHHHYAVLSIPDYPRLWPAAIVVAARIVDDFVVIDEDTTDKPLWKELVRAGIPREKIVCLYAGEQIPNQQAS